MARLIVVGDTFLGGEFSRGQEVSGDTFMSEELRERLLGADAVICNLEAPITDSTSPIQIPGKHRFRAPAKAISALEWSGIGVATLANNHMMDFGVQGLKDTLRALDSIGVRYTGAGEDGTEARQPALIQCGNLRVAVLAYTRIDAPYRRQVPYAGVGSAGVARLVCKDVQGDISQALDQADVVVLSLHWKNSHLRLPHPVDLYVARELIDAGATIVFGHHPHIVRGIERYKSGLIAYSLGNFFFPNHRMLHNNVVSYGEAGQLHGSPGLNRLGLALAIDFCSSGVLEYEALPVVQERHKPFVSFGSVVMQRRFARQLEAWSAPLLETDYRNHYRLYSSLLRGSPRGIISSILGIPTAIRLHLEQRGIEGVLRRVNEVIRGYVRLWMKDW